MMFWFSSSLAAFIVLALSAFQATAFLSPLQPITGRQFGTRDQRHERIIGVTRQPHYTCSALGAKNLVIGRQSTANEQESLNRLLETLTQRGIRFKPDATRSELEELLRSSTVSGLTPLNELLAELDRRNIQYPPSAARRELEQLLKDTNHAVVEQDSNHRSAAPYRREKRGVSSATTDSTDPSHESFSKGEYGLDDVLAELDRRGVRYAPTATRSELETLLLNSSAKDTQLNGVKFKLLRAELDRRGIPYSKSSSLSELENLVKSDDQEIVFKVDSGHTEDGVTQLDEQNAFSEDEPKLSQAERRMQRRRNRQSQRRDIAIDRMLEPAQDIPRRISETIQSTPVSKRLQKMQKKIVLEAGRATDRVIDFLEELPEDDDEEETPVEVEVLQPRRRRGPRNSQRLARPPVPDRGARASLPSPRSPPDDRAVPFPDPKNREGRRSYFEDDRETFTERERNARVGAARPPPRRQRPPPITNKRIYSPYPPRDAEDVIDKVGKFVADAAESVLPEREGEENQQGDWKVPAGHWKERLSKKFDQALGYGDRLIDLPKRDYNSPYQPPLSQLRRPQGSILSILLGGPPQPGQGGGEQTAALERLFGRRSGTTGVTSFLGTGIRGAATFVGYLCQWASVRGVVPQPVVAFLLMGVTLSARRNRIWTFLGTLLVTRIVGETFHNSLYGPDVDGEWEAGNELRDVSESRDWNDKLHPGSMDNRMRAPPPRSRRSGPGDLEHPHGDRR